MTNLENSIHESDPTWDYYIEWHKLIRAKAQLEKLIDFISKVKDAIEDTQEILFPDIFSLILLPLAILYTLIFSTLGCTNKRPKERSQSQVFNRA